MIDDNKVQDYGDFVKKEIISDEEDPLEIDKEHPLQNESADFSEGHPKTENVYLENTYLEQMVDKTKTFDNLDIKLEEEDHDIANEANEETMDYV